MATSHLQRWAIQLRAYDYDIRYRSTKQNLNADSLSRLPIDTVTDINEDTAWDKEAVAVNLVQIRNLPITSKQIVLATKRDIVLQKLAHYIVTGWPNANEISPELLPYYARRDAFTI